MAHMKVLQTVINTNQKLIGHPLPSLKDLFRLGPLLLSPEGTQHSEGLLKLRELEGARKPDGGDGVVEGRSLAGEQGNPWLEVFKSEGLKDDWLRRNADLALIGWSGDA
ncbi:hypothetical protein CRENBAI_005719 [Crenichthys baileyi]|uniref:Uncharacterized protein n=1 Tax=Crenichthys baileyi TaxID=28760 RepID=A0AAV9R560_9TELE